MIYHDISNDVIFGWYFVGACGPQHCHHIPRYANRNVGERHKTAQLPVSRDVLCDGGPNVIVNQH